MSLAAFHFSNVTVAEYDIIKQIAEQETHEYHMRRERDIFRKAWLDGLQHGGLAALENQTDFQRSKLALLEAEFITLADNVDTVPVDIDAGLHNALQEIGQAVSAASSSEFDNHPPQLDHTATSTPPPPVSFIEHYAMERGSDSGSENAVTETTEEEWRDLVRLIDLTLYTGRTLVDRHVPAEEQIHERSLARSEELSPRQRSVADFADDANNVSESRYFTAEESEQVEEDDVEYHSTRPYIPNTILFSQWIRMVQEQDWSEEQQEEEDVDTITTPSMMTPADTEEKDDESDADPLPEQYSAGFSVNVREGPFTIERISPEEAEYVSGPMEDDDEEVDEYLAPRLEVRQEQSATTRQYARPLPRMWFL